MKKEEAGSERKKQLQMQGRKRSDQELRMVRSQVKINRDQLEDQVYRHSTSIKIQLNVTLAVYFHLKTFKNHNLLM